MTESPLILAVDDNEAGLLLITTLLEGDGFRVDGASSADEVLKRLQVRAPDLILMDVQLPGQDGLSLTRQLKADPATAHIPVVALTAHDGSGELQRATRAGCDWFVPKPCPPDALITEIRRILATPR